MFERGRCAEAADARYAAHASAELERFRLECTDPASTARITKIQKTCMPRYQLAIDGVRDERRAIRAKHLDAVSELLIDPEYPPAFDAFRDAEASVERGEPGATEMLQARRQTLMDLAKKHGVDPAYSKELELW